PGAAVQRQGYRPGGAQGPLLLLGDAGGPEAPAGTFRPRLRRRLLSAEGKNDPGTLQRPRLAGHGAPPDPAGAGGAAGQPAGEVAFGAGANAAGRAGRGAEDTGGGARAGEAGAFRLGGGRGGVVSGVAAAGRFVPGAGACGPGSAVPERFPQVIQERG